MEEKKAKLPDCIRSEEDVIRLAKALTNEDGDLALVSVGIFNTKTNSYTGQLFLGSVDGKLVARARLLGHHLVSVSQSTLQVGQRISDAMKLSPQEAEEFNAAWNAAVAIGAAEAAKTFGIHESKVSLAFKPSPEKKTE